MPDAERAVQDAANRLPAEVRQRFETADTLSDEDRALVTEVARQAIARVRLKPEPQRTFDAEDNAETVDPVGPAVHADPIDTTTGEQYAGPDQYRP